MYTNATVIFEDSTGISGSGIGAVNSGILFNGITKFVNNSATEGGAIHINVVTEPVNNKISTYPSEAAPYSLATVHKKMEHT